MSDKPEEFRDMKDELVEEKDIEGVESRSVDLGYEVLHVLVVTLEYHVGESWEDNTCERR